MENYHYLSHRRQSHGGDGAPIPDSDQLHHFVDVQFAQTFRYLLEHLEAYVMPDGQNLLDAGVSVWLNDLSNGPGHGRTNVPYVMAGSAGGLLRTGQFIELEGSEDNHARLLNTLGSAAGLRAPNGELISDFGDPGQSRSPLDALLA